MAEDNATKRGEFTAKLERAINASDKTQTEIAMMCGYNNPNVITMIKRGSSRLPLDKVATIAQALDLDPAELMKEWIATYIPEAKRDMETHLLIDMTPEERSWIRGLRRTIGQVPMFNTKFAEMVRGAL